MLTTLIGAQYLQAALARWRGANPWASHVPWEKLPRRYKDEIETAARVNMLCGKLTVVEAEGFVADPDAENLAA